MSEHFCYLAPQRDRVNLGFFHGSDLPDPDGLLEGTGKKLRHVKVRSVEQAEFPATGELIRTSLVDRKAALKLQGKFSTAADKSTSRHSLKTYGRRQP
jgi:hypothetical protein